MLYPIPGTEQSTVKYKEKYDNYINGQWVSPVNGEYFNNHSPANGQLICKVARSDAADIELALDAAHNAKKSLG